MNNLIFKKDTHQYFNGKEEKYSVSKILSNYLGNSFECKECNSEINNCQCILGDCKFCTNVKQASLKGYAVHKVAELYFKNINKENIVKKIKDKIIHLFNEQTLAYCFTLLDYLQENFNKDCNTISEKPISYDIVAGTPDLIYNYYLYDFKTSKTMTPKQLHYAKLQITAYYWIILKNEFFTDNNNGTILHINAIEVKNIKFQITNELIKEWEQALKLFKEKLKNGYTITSKY